MFPAVIFQVQDGVPLAVAALRCGGTEAQPLDLILDQYTEFTVQGPSSVHVTGVWVVRTEHHLSFTLSPCSVVVVISRWHQLTQDSLGGNRCVLRQRKARVRAEAHPMSLPGCSRSVCCHIGECMACVQGSRPAVQAVDC